MGTGTDYYIWVRYHIDSGAGDGHMSVAFDTSDSEITSGNQYRELTTHTRTAQTGKLRLYVDTDSAMLYDDVQVTEWDGE